MKYPSLKEKNYNVYTVNINQAEILLIFKKFLRLNVHNANKNQAEIIKRQKHYLLDNLPIRGWSDLIDKRNQTPLFLQLLRLKIRSSEQPRNEK